MFPGQVDLCLLWCVAILIGTTGAHYVLEFDKSFQTVEGTVEGKVFAPGVDPLHPGEAAPIAQFTDEFTAQRVSP